MGRNLSTDLAAQIAKINSNGKPTPDSRKSEAKTSRQICKNRPVKDDIFLQVVHAT